MIDDTSLGEKKTVGRNNLGKLVLSFVLVIGAVAATAADVNTTHLFNPAWHPHARFHDALFLLFFDATSLLVLWLLWRRSPEPTLGVTVAALFLAAAWTPFFYIEPLIPGTSLLASDDMPGLKILSIFFPANQIVAAVAVLLTIVGYWLARDVSNDA